MGHGWGEPAASGAATGWLLVLGIAAVVQLAAVSGTTKLARFRKRRSTGSLTAGQRRVQPRPTATVTLQTAPAAAPMKA